MFEEFLKLAVILVVVGVSGAIVTGGLGAICPLLAAGLGIFFLFVVLQALS
jgi:hypothetical protein